MADLASQFIAIRQADLQTRVDYAVMRKMLDTQAETGDAAVKLIESAAKSQGQMLDAVSSLTDNGLGGTLDINA